MGPSAGFLPRCNESFLRLTEKCYPSEIFRKPRENWRNDGC